MEANFASGSIEKTKKKETNNSRALSELKKMMKKCENEKAKLESKLSVKNEQLKQNQQKIKKLKNQMENYKSKFTLAELERIQFQSQIALLEQRAESSKPTQVEGQAGLTGGNLLQDMMDNFRELAETHLQCVVCSELFVDGVSINCGHTFCDYCISKWRKQKNNCPVCRTNIRAANPIKVLDEYSDKIFEQFVLEGAKKSRATLKEERAKLKAESVRPRNNREVFSDTSYSSSSSSSSTSAEGSASDSD